MKSTLIQHRITLFMLAAITMLGFAARGAQAQALPTPEVKFGGTEDYAAGGKQWTRYKLLLLNRSAYANELFAPAPDLPPCGANKNSARTWVDIYNRQGRQRIYGFCNLQQAQDLGNLWFAVEKGMPPPESVYITITDRRSKTRATSNVVAIPSTSEAKVPPAGKGPFVPDLRLRGSESVELNPTVPKGYYKVTFLFENWRKFPAEMLQQMAKPSSLPPDPCKQVKGSSRLFAVLVAEDKRTLGCTQLRPKEEFYFLVEEGKTLPDFVYVAVVDRQTDKIYRSSLVSPSSGLTK